MGGRRSRRKKGNKRTFRGQKGSFTEALPFLLGLLENSKLMPHVKLDKDYRQLNKKLEG
jgi:hypothetical protein